MSDVYEVPAAEQQTCLSVNPDIVQLIIELTEKTIEIDKDTKWQQALVHATHHVLKIQDVGSVNDTTEAILVYYLAAYMQYGQCLLLLNHTDPDRDVLQREAILALFETYITDPQSHLVKMILIKAVHAIGAIVTKSAEDDTTIDLKLAAAAWTDMGIVIESFSRYIKSRYAIKNLPYVLWTKGYFEICLSKPDLSELIDYPQLKTIIKDIRSRKRIIRTYFTM